MSVFTNDVTVEPGANPISVTGSSVSVSNFPAVQPVSGTVAVTQSTTPWVVSAPTSGTANITQVVATNAVNVQLIAANAARKKVIIYLPKGSATSYLKYGATASSTSFTYIITSNATIITEDTYTGEIDFNGAAQTVTITELV